MQNPEEFVQAKSYLRLIKDYNYLPQNIAVNEAVQVGSETKEADILVYSDDFKKILKHSTSTGMFPVYFEDYSKNMKDFILDTCKALYNILKYQENYKQIEINEFISLLKLSLQGYGIDKDYGDLKRFYSRYAHELSFKHLTSRDSKKFVKLLNQSGEIRNFAYISLE